VKTILTSILNNILTSILNNILTSILNTIPHVQMMTGILTLT